MPKLVGAFAQPRNQCNAALGREPAKHRRNVNGVRLQTRGSWQRRRNAAAKLDHLSQFLPDFPDLELDKFSILIVGHLSVQIVGGR
jgi:hypothetical protein